MKSLFFSNQRKWTDFPLNMGWWPRSKS